MRRIKSLGRRIDLFRPEPCDLQTMIVSRASYPTPSLSCSIKASTASEGNLNFKRLLFSYCMIFPFWPLTSPPCNFLSSFLVYVFFSPHLTFFPGEHWIEFLCSDAPRVISSSPSLALLFDCHQFRGEKHSYSLFMAAEGLLSTFIFFLPVGAVSFSPNRSPKLLFFVVSTSRCVFSIDFGQLKSLPSPRIEEIIEESSSAHPDPL